MHLAGLQLDSVWEDKPASFARARSCLERTPPPPGSLIVLPEMFATGFSLAPDRTAQGEPGLTQGFLAGIARQHRSFVLGGLVTPGPSSRPRNEAIAFSPTGGLIGRYAKIHPFSPGGEAQVHESGAEVVLFDWNGLRVAPFICYDLRFPEVFRAAAGRGAELLVVIACWPSKRLQHWITLLQARAIENQAYVAGINRTGHEPQTAYAGRSLVVDPQGTIIADAGEGEGVVTASLDVEAMRSWRRDFPALRDRRWKSADPC